MIFKLTKVFVVTFLFLFFSQVTVDALTVQSRTEEENTFNLVVDATEKPSVGLQVRLGIIGGTVESVELSNSNDLVIGACGVDPTALYDQSRVCFDLARGQGDLKEGESIATIKVKQQVDSIDVTFFKEEENGYLIEDGQIYIDSSLSEESSSTQALIQSRSVNNSPNYNTAEFIITSFSIYSITILALILLVIKNRYKTVKMIPLYGQTIRKEILNLGVYSLIGLFILIAISIGLRLSTDLSPDNSNAQLSDNIYTVCEGTGDCTHNGSDYAPHNGDAIRAAVTAAETGDIIYISAGTYTFSEDATKDYGFLVHNKSIFIQGPSGENTVTLDGQGNHSNGIVLAAAEGSQLSNIVVENFKGSGVITSTSNSKTTVSLINIRTTKNNHGFASINGSRLNIHNSVAFDNNINGFLSVGSTQGVFHSIATNNGVGFKASGPNTHINIYHSTAVSNDKGERIGYLAENQAVVDAYYSHAFDNQGGKVVERSGAGVGFGRTNVAGDPDPKFVAGSAGHGWKLKNNPPNDVSPLIDAGNPAGPFDRDGTDPDIGAYGGPYLCYVDPDLDICSAPPPISPFVSGKITCSDTGDTLDGITVELFNETTDSSGEVLTELKTSPSGDISYKFDLVGHSPNHNYTIRIKDRFPVATSYGAPTTSGTAGVCTKNASTYSGCKFPATGGVENKDFEFDCQPQEDKQIKIFVTSERYSGNLRSEANTLVGTTDPPRNGIQSAHAICQHHADQANLGGEWAAWIGAQRSGRSYDMARDSGIPLDVQFETISGELLARDYARLVSKYTDSRYLRNDIHQSEFMQTVAPRQVWTGLDSTGISTGSATCTGWTGGGNAFVGLTGTFGAWTNGYATGAQSCGTIGQARLYCMQVTEEDPAVDITGTVRGSLKCRESGSFVPDAKIEFYQEGPASVLTDTITTDSPISGFPNYNFEMSSTVGTDKRYTVRVADLPDGYDGLGTIPTDELSDAGCIMDVIDGKYFSPRSCTFTVDAPTINNIQFEVDCPGEAGQLGMFVTSQAYSGNLVSEANSNTEISPVFTADQGLEAGDAICQYHAENAQLQGDWIAWLSDTETSARDRFTVPNSSFRNFGPGTLSQTLLANNLADLASCEGDADNCIINPVGFDEYGKVAAHNSVWTGTNNIGRTASGTCNNWEDSTTTASGTTGSATEKSTDWTLAGNQSCDKKKAVYCVQQSGSFEGPQVTPTTAPSEELRVFVSSGKYSGDLYAEANEKLGTSFTQTESLKAADALCQDHAGTAGIARVDTEWKAFLGHSSLGKAQDRLIGIGNTDDIYNLNPAGSQLVAAGVDDIGSCESHSNCLVNAIKYDENGDAPTDANDFRVWTGTQEDGTSSVFDVAHCDDWTSKESANSGLGIYGNRNQNSFGWAALESAGCNVPRNIYCFEQYKVEELSCSIETSKKSGGTIDTARIGDRVRYEVTATNSEVPGTITEVNIPLPAGLEIVEDNLVSLPGDCRYEEGTVAGISDTLSEPITKNNILAIAIGVTIAGTLGVLIITRNQSNSITFKVGSTKFTSQTVLALSSAVLAIGLVSTIIIINNQDSTQTTTDIEAATSNKVICRFTAGGPEVIAQFDTTVVSGVADSLEIEGIAQRGVHTSTPCTDSIDILDHSKRRIFIAEGGNRSDGDVVAFANDNYSGTFDDAFEAADGVCQAVSTFHGYGGKWQAWLSSGDIDAISRFDNLEDELVNIRNQTIVQNFHQLENCPTNGADCLENAVRYNGQNNEVAASLGIWTGTDHSGAVSPGTCSAWTNDQPATHGTAGDPLSTGSSWTQDTDQASCNELRGFYCIEQDVSLIDLIFVEPQAGDDFQQGSRLSIEATTQDDGELIDKVTFSLNGTNLGEGIEDPAETYILPAVVPVDMPKGIQTLIANAYNADNEVIGSASVDIEVTEMDLNIEVDVPGEDIHRGFEEEVAAFIYNITDDSLPLPEINEVIFLYGLTEADAEEIGAGTEETIARPGSTSYVYNWTPPEDLEGDATNIYAKITYTAGGEQFEKTGVLRVDITDDPPFNLPDLTIESVILTQEAVPTCGEHTPTGTRVSIKNEGEEDATTFKVRVNESAVLTVASLARNTSISLWFNNAVSGAGQTTKVEVDVDNEVSESNESNNLFEESVPIPTLIPTCPPVTTPPVTTPPVTTPPVTTPPVTTPPVTGTIIPTNTLPPTLTPTLAPPIYAQCQSKSATLVDTGATVTTARVGEVIRYKIELDRAANRTTIIRDDLPEGLKLVRQVFDNTRCVASDVLGASTSTTTKQTNYFGVLSASIVIVAGFGFIILSGKESLGIRISNDIQLTSKQIRSGLVGMIIIGSMGTIAYVNNIENTTPDEIEAQTLGPRTIECYLSPGQTQITFDVQVQDGLQGQTVTNSVDVIYEGHDVITTCDVSFDVDSGPGITPSITYTPTPEPTSTPIPSNSPIPSDTPIPSGSIIPSNTPIPTAPPGSSPTPIPTSVEGAIDCGLMDIDSDGNLKIGDFAAFATHYPATCQQARVITTGCGGKDSNGDGLINVVDLQSFASRYFPATNASCNL